MKKKKRQGKVLGALYAGQSTLQPPRPVYHNNFRLLIHITDFEPSINQLNCTSIIAKYEGLT